MNCEVYDSSCFPPTVYDEMGPALLIPVTMLNDKGKEVNGTIPCPSSMHWRCRGEELKDLTCSEYYAIIGHRPYTTKQQKDIMAQEKKGQKVKRRPGSTEYPFDPTHPLHKTHCQYIKSLQPTLVHNIYMPKFPGVAPPNRCSKNTESGKNVPINGHRQF